MIKEPTFKELLAHINSAADDLKANCSIGLFVSDYYDETVKEVDSFVVKKPIINISSFLDENELFYTIQFCFKSYDDVDFKQMWKFICKYTEKAKSEREYLNSGKELEKISVLSISILPDMYKGKYSVYANMPLLETISCTTNAFDKSAVISVICTDEGFNALAADEDIIDRRSIEREVENEILAEKEDEENRM